MSNRPDPKLGCHRTGFTKKCRKLVDGDICNRWVVVHGTHPITGEQVSTGDCADNWLLTFTQQNCKLQNETAASVDKVASEVDKLRQTVIDLNDSTDIAARSLRIGMEKTQ